MDLRALTWLALGLVVIWFAAALVFKVVGALVHLLLVAAAVLLLVRLFQRTRRRGPTPLV
jgi:Flp pilus assembly protein TadB